MGTNLYQVYFVIECDENQYGLECNTSCGNCFLGEQCHHLTGNCPDGCDEGFFGDKCDKGKSSYMYEQLRNNFTKTVNN